MTTPERRKKSRQNRAANRHFQALRANQMRTGPSRRRWKHRGPIPAEPLAERDRRPIRGFESESQNGNSRALERHDEAGGKVSNATLVIAEASLSCPTNLQNTRGNMLGEGWPKSPKSLRGPSHLSTCTYLMLIRC
jgi:hypothetical protein